MTTSDDRTADRNSPGASGSASPASSAGAAPQPFKFVPSPSAPEVSYADGAAGLTLGRGVFKLDLYQAVGLDPETQKELRAVSHRIVLPLSAVPELTNLLERYREAVEAASQKQTAAEKKQGR